MKGFGFLSPSLSLPPSVLHFLSLSPSFSLSLLLSSFLSHSLKRQATQGKFTGCIKIHSIILNGPVSPRTCFSFCSELYKTHLSPGFQVCWLLKKNFTLKTLWGQESGPGCFLSFSEHSFFTVTNIGCPFFRCYSLTAIAAAIQNRIKYFKSLFWIFCWHCKPETFQEQVRLFRIYS